MLLPECKCKKIKRFSEMAVQDYTRIMEGLETLKCTTCRPKSNLTFNGEFELHLGDKVNFGMNIREGGKY